MSLKNTLSGLVAGLLLLAGCSATEAHSQTLVVYPEGTTVVATPSSVIGDNCIALIYYPTGYDPRTGVPIDDIYVTFLTDRGVCEDLLRRNYAQCSSVELALTGDTQNVSGWGGLPVGELDADCPY